MKNMDQFVNLKNLEGSICNFQKNWGPICIYWKVIEVNLKILKKRGPSCKIWNNY